MGNRLTFNQVKIKDSFKASDGSVRIVVNAAGISVQVRSKLVKRSSDDLKNSRASAYNYLIP